MNRSCRNTRRRFLRQAARVGVSAFVGRSVAGLLDVDDARACLLQQDQTERFPLVTHGVASGEVTGDSAVLWARGDRPARMWIELAATEAFRNPRRIRGPAALEVDDFTARMRLAGLPAGEEVFYRIFFEDLEQPGRLGPAASGRFAAAPRSPRGIRFLWSGDTAGQGFGIDADRGGMRTYAAMTERKADFFVHSGDLIYADNPFPESITMPDGSTWRNLVTEETAKVAETLAEFRGNFRYNLLDEHVRRFNATTPMLAQWDDHETCNNWYPGEILRDGRYTVVSASLLAERARRAFFEYTPSSPAAAARGRIHRRIAYGPQLDLFFLDMRSFRGPNSANRQTASGPETDYLGREQLAWLTRELAQSQAVWKVICADMPLGLIVRDGLTHFENSANGDGPPLGRELEIAGLLSRMKRDGVRNVIWLTADVHYAASHYYDPQHAVFSDFDPFWEFVSGPLHAGSFGPNALDNTFGPRVEFQTAVPGQPMNGPPSEGRQYFGEVEIAVSGELTVSHFDQSGARLWERTLAPAV